MSRGYEVDECPKIDATEKVQYCRIVFDCENLCVLNKTPFPRVV